MPIINLPDKEDQAGGDFSAISFSTIQFLFEQLFLATDMNHSINHIDGMNNNNTLDTVFELPSTAMRSPGRVNL
jgi:hypothetical protein